MKTLIYKIRSSNSEEYKEALVKQLWPPVYSVTSKFFKNPSERSENTNFVLGKVFTKIGYFDLKKPVLSYIKLLAHNHCIDEYRKKKRKKRSAEPLTGDIAYTPEEPTQLLEKDWKDLYWFVAKKNDRLASILYDIDRLDKSLETVATEHNRTVEEIKKIKKIYIDKRLTNLKRKVR